MTEHAPSALSRARTSRSACYARYVLQTRAMIAGSIDRRKNKKSIKSTVILECKPLTLSHFCDRGLEAARVVRRCCAGGDGGERNSSSFFTEVVR